MNRPRLVVSGNLNSSFVAEDVRILSDDFDVLPVHHRGRRGLLGLYKGIRSSNLCLSWFADSYAGIAQHICGWQRKPHVAIVGGYEVAGEDDSGYGLLAQKGPGGIFSRRFLHHILAHATAVVVPSQFTRGEVLRLTHPSRLEVIPPSVDLKKFIPRGKVAGVGTLAEAESFQDLKGLGTFLLAAAEIPELDFHVVGTVRDDEARRRAPPNVRFHGHLDHEAVSRFLGGLRVYCQLSRRESFGLATAEAMASGCVPVVSTQGGLPEVVGDVGLQVAYGDVGGTVEAIRTAAALPTPYLEGRQRVEACFSLEVRHQRLTGLLESILNAPSARGPAARPRVGY